jgi:hypothetical protein
VKDGIRFGLACSIYGSEGVSSKKSTQDPDGSWILRDKRGQFLARITIAEVVNRKAEQKARKQREHLYRIELIPIECEKGRAFRQLAEQRLGTPKAYDSKSAPLYRRCDVERVLAEILRDPDRAIIESLSLRPEPGKSKIYKRQERAALRQWKDSFLTRKELIANGADPKKVKALSDPDYVEKNRPYYGVTHYFHPEREDVLRLILDRSTLHEMTGYDS